MTLKEAQPSAPPQTPEPLKGKYSACRICGRGASSKAAHRTIATHGVHTDALHQPNRPNNGTAYCDQCEDETLVILSAPLAPAVEPEPPICGCGRVLNVGESTCWICESLPSAVEPDGPEGCICPRDGGVCWSCGGTPCTPPKEENRNE